MKLEAWVIRPVGSAVVAAGTKGIAVMSGVRVLPFYVALTVQLFLSVPASRGQSPVPPGQSPAPAADLITFLQVQQQAGSDIIYRVGQTTKIAALRFDPCTPQGLGDANLCAATTECGVSGTASLRSRFLPNRLTVTGSMSVSSTWKDVLPDAEQTTGGARALFLSRFVVGDTPVVLSIDGTSGVTVIGERRLPFGRPPVCLRLTGGSSALLWHMEPKLRQLEPGSAPAQRAAGATPGDFARAEPGQWQVEPNDLGLKAVTLLNEKLLPHQEYRLAIYAEAGAIADPQQADQQSQAAWFDLNVTVAADPAPPTGRQLAVLALRSPGLELLQLDGQPLEPWRTDQSLDCQEYLIPAGEHTLTLASHAVARSKANPRPGRVNTVEEKGLPLTIKHFFLTGRRYTAFCRTPAQSQPKSRDWIQMLTGTPPQPQSSWSMEIVELAEARDRLNSGGGADELNLTAEVLETIEKRPALENAGEI